MDLEHFSAAGISAVIELVENRTEESHKIDFKRKTDPSRSDLTREDKKALGEATSGFANAEGGILIVGVDTQDFQGLDRASAVCAIDNVDAVADRYRAYLSECVSPPINGIQVLSLKVESLESGVIVISIPKGEARPHMSTAPGHHRFYRRVADRFQQMERYEIYEMFRLEDYPNLELMISYRNGGSLGGNSKTNILFGLKNISGVTAKFPYISIKNDQSAPRVAEFGLDGNGGNLFKKLTTEPGSEILFSGGSDIVIHPGQSLFISQLEYLHNLDERISRYWSAASLGPQGTCVVEFAFGCEHHPRQRVRAEFTCSNLLNLEMPNLTVY